MELEASCFRSRISSEANFALEASKSDGLLSNYDNPPMALLAEALSILVLEEDESLRRRNFGMAPRNEVGNTANESY